MKNQVFTPQNCISVFILVPIILMYFQMNSNVSDGGTASIIAKYNIYQYILLAEFLFFEFLIYAILIYKYYKKCLLYYIAVFSLAAIPFLHIISGDFYMRASIPALFILMLLIIRYLFDTKNRRALLIFCLVVGAITPLMEFRRGFHYIKLLGRINITADDIKTFNRSDLKLENFAAKDYENSYFFKYFAKTRKGLIYE